MTDAESDYRRAMAHLASGVCVVSARAGNVDLAMTATSVVSVSIDPPTLLFCVYSDARLAEAIDDGAAWAVSVLSQAAGSEADWLASPGRPAIGQLDRVAHRRGEHSGAALLDNASAWLECETEWVKAAGSHDVVVGRVVTAVVAPQARGGLVHHRGRIRVLG